VGNGAEMLNLAVGEVVVFGAHGARTVEAVAHGWLRANASSCAVHGRS